MSLLFREGNNNHYQNTPHWVESMLQLGYDFCQRVSAKGRIIGLLSMPCGSVAAPMIALGSLRKSLEIDSAHHLEKYLEYLICKIEKERAEGKVVYLRDQNNRKWKFVKVFSGERISVTDAGYKELVKRKGRLVKNPNGPCSTSINRQNAIYWRFEGDPVAFVGSSRDSLDNSIYERLPGCTGEIINENLQRSWLGLLLVSNASGKSSDYWKRLNESSFEINDSHASLCDLLTINNNLDCVRRMKIVSYRNLQEVDVSPELVLADGSRSFIKALDKFHNVDVIGVIDRGEPMENLEILSNKLQEIGRYYEKSEREFFVNPLPRSIGAQFMERR